MRGFERILHVSKPKVRTTIKGCTIFR